MNFHFLDIPEKINRRITILMLFPSPNLNNTAKSDWILSHILRKKKHPSWILIHGIKPKPVKIRFLTTRKHFERPRIPHSNSVCKTERWKLFTQMNTSSSEKRGELKESYLQIQKTGFSFGFLSGFDLSHSFGSVTQWELFLTIYI